MNICLHFYGFSMNLPTLEKKTLKILSCVDLVGTQRSSLFCLISPIVQTCSVPNYSFVHLFYFVSYKKSKFTKRISKQLIAFHSRPEMTLSTVSFDNCAADIYYYTVSSSSGSAATFHPNFSASTLARCRDHKLI